MDRKVRGCKEQIDKKIIILSIFENTKFGDIKKVLDWKKRGGIFKYLLELVFIVSVQ